MPPIAASTRCPGCRSESSASTTSPAHSMPSTRGKLTASPEPPERVTSSARFRPNARTRTTIQPGRGCGIGRSSTLQHLRSTGLVDNHRLHTRRRYSLTTASSAGTAQRPAQPTARLVPSRSATPRRRARRASRAPTQPARAVRSRPRARRRAEPSARSARSRTCRAISAKELLSRRQPASGSAAVRVEAGGDEHELGLEGARGGQHDVLDQRQPQILFRAGRDGQVDRVALAGARADVAQRPVPG